MSPSRLLLAVALSSLGLAWPGSAHAQAPSPHAAGGTQPSPHGVDGTQPSPHGVDGTQPSALPQPEVPEDQSDAAPDLPPGTIEVWIADGQRRAMPGVRVRLGIMYQKISEGESRSERFATTDQVGRVRFTDLKGASEYSYRVTVERGPATYSCMPFNLRDKMGHRVQLHVLPVARSLRDALIGMRGFLYVEPRDDIFQVQVLFRVFNVGAVTWVPDQVIMQLPHGFKAFDSSKGMTDVGFEAAEGRGARLVGTFTPGQHDVSYRFQIPKEREANVTFSVGYLPRTAEMRVIVEASSQMGLSVEGFEEPQIASSHEGKRVLVTRRLMQHDIGDERFTVSITGLPVPGPGRWIAVLIASAFGGLGIAAARGHVRLDAPDRAEAQDRLTAKELLVKELLAVERARQDGGLGPRAYGEARRTLLEALARLGSDILAPKKASKRRRTTGG